MSKPAFILFATVLWIAPALVAGMLGWPMTIAIAVVPAAAFASLNLVTSERLQEDFLRGRPEQFEQRGDGGL